MLETDDMLQGKAHKTCWNVPASFPNKLMEISITIFLFYDRKFKRILSPYQKKYAQVPPLKFVTFHKKIWKICDQNQENSLMTRKKACFCHLYQVQWAWLMKRIKPISCSSPSFFSLIWLVSQISSSSLWFPTRN